MRLSVLFVCTGNICRSPTAEGVFRALVSGKSLDGRIHVESAGTHDYHVGDPPDRRAIAHARKRGYDISALRARQVAPGDFERFDLILAMDRGHLALLQQGCPPEHRGKLRLFLDDKDVPDPYYGGPDGFEQVLDLVEAASHGLVEELRSYLSRVST